MKNFITTILFMLFCVLAMQGNCADGTYILYRNSFLDKNMRIHIATFDSKEKSDGGTSDSYNKFNCNLAASLFLAQPMPNIANNYWCEIGKVNP